MSKSSNYPCVPSVAVSTSGGVLTISGEYGEVLNLSPSLGHRNMEGILIVGGLTEDEGAFIALSEFAIIRVGGAWRVVTAAGDPFEWGVLALSGESKMVADFMEGNPSRVYSSAREMYFAGKRSLGISHCDSNEASADFADSCLRVAAMHNRNQ